MLSKEGGLHTIWVVSDTNFSTVTGSLIFPFQVTANLSPALLGMLL